MEINYQYLTPVIANILRYLIFAGIPFLIFYKLFPHYFIKNRIQSKLGKRKDFIREILHSLQTSLILACISILILFTSLKEYTYVYHNLADYPIWWVPISILLGLFIQDTYLYWTHRMMHYYPKLYKRTHLTHHKSLKPSPWASFSFDFIEGVIYALLAPIILFFLPIHINALLILLFISITYSTYAHLGFEIAPRWFRNSFLFKILNTSVHHNLHHEKFNGNYGLYFRFWDKVMKTEHPEYITRYDLVQAKRFGLARKNSSSLFSKVGILIILFCSLGFISMNAQSTIEGKWKDSKEGAIILIYKESGHYYGKVIHSNDAKKNAMIKEKDILVLRDFQQVDEKEYCCGTLSRPNMRITLSGTLLLKDSGTLIIYAKYGFIKYSRTWLSVE